MFAYTKDNKVIHIKDALVHEEYVCIKCKGKLGVKDGNIRAKHFFHKAKDCGDRGESFVHECWKKYFSKLKKFDGYNIIASRQEYHLLNGTYIPDIILKTDKNNYIIIEVNYKNSKDKSYLEKFKLLPKNYIKVFEIKVEFGKILSIKILFNREKEKKLQIEIEKKRKYILDTYYGKGGLIYKVIKNDNSKFNYIPPILHLYFNKDIHAKYKEVYNDFTWKKLKEREIPLSSRGKEFKVHLEEENGDIKVISKSFSIMIYDYINMSYYFKQMNTSSVKLVSQDANLIGNITVVLDEKI